MATPALDGEVTIHRTTRYAAAPRSVVLSGVGLLALAALAGAATAGLRPLAPSRTAMAGGDVRYEREVLLPMASSGCRWMNTGDPEVQIAECGDELDTVRLVFRAGRVTEYHVVVRGAPAAQGTPSTASYRWAPSGAGP